MAEELCYREKCYLAAPEYFTGSVIVVDAPPATQKNHEFFAINHILSHAGLLVPTIICSDLNHGFMVQEDLGQSLFSDKLVECPEHTLELYRSALKAMAKIAALPLGFADLDRVNQARQRLNEASPDTQAELRSRVARYELDSAELNYLEKLPPFDDAFIKMELGIFTEWCLDKALHLSLSPAEEQMLEESFAFLSASCQRQKQVAMHRDFHSRNLMVLPASWPQASADAEAEAEVSEPEAAELRLAMLDYQDMVKGPLGYDVASLLYDCYTVLSPEHLKALLAECAQNYRLNGLLSAECSDESFAYEVKICAIQRHLKVLGIFNRLYLRDGKAGYLKDLPRVLNYLLENCRDIPELKGLHCFLDERLRPLIIK